MCKIKSSVKMLVFFVLLMTIGFSVTAIAAPKKLKKPVLMSVEQTEGMSVSIKWNKVKKAKMYELYVSVNGSKFKKLVSVKASEYKQKNAIEGFTYKYKVRSINGKKKSGFSNIKSVKIASVSQTPGIGQSSIISENYDKLKQIILNTGKKNESGDLLIGIRYQYGVYSISYHPGSDSFSFYMSLEDNDLHIFIEVPVNREALNASIVHPVFAFFHMGMEVAFEADTTLNMNTYNNTSLQWNLTKTNGDYPDFQKLANSSLSSGFSGWVDLLQTLNTNLTLNNLGFTGYTG